MFNVRLGKKLLKSIEWSGQHTLKNNHTYEIHLST